MSVLIVSVIAKHQMKICLKLYYVHCSLLFLKVMANNDKEQYAFCSVKGCERVKITAVIPKGSPPSNCMAQAYPRHAELPVVDVPMPRKIPNARLVRRGGLSLAN